MGVVIGVQHIPAVRNWTVWCRFLGDWSDDDWSVERTNWNFTVKRYIDEDCTSCCSTDAILGDW